MSAGLPLYTIFLNCYRVHYFSISTLVVYLLCLFILFHTNLQITQSFIANSYVLHFKMLGYLVNSSITILQLRLVYNNYFSYFCFFKNTNLGISLIPWTMYANDFVGLLPIPVQNSFFFSLQFKLILLKLDLYISWGQLMDPIEYLFFFFFKFTLTRTPCNWFGCLLTGDEAYLGHLIWFFISSFCLSLVVFCIYFVQSFLFLVFPPFIQVLDSFQKNWS